MKLKTNVLVGQNVGTLYLSHRLLTEIARTHHPIKERCRRFTIRIKRDLGAGTEYLSYRIESTGVVYYMKECLEGAKVIFP